MTLRIFRTRVLLHPLLCFLLPLSLFCGGSMLPMLFAFLTHEFGHILCAVIFSIPIREITLSPMGGVMDCDTSAAGPLKCALLSLSGPLSSLLGYAACYLLISKGMGPAAFFIESLRLHLLLFAFNLLPLLPLDGGQCLLALFRHNAHLKRVLFFLTAIFSLLLTGLSVLYAANGILFLAPALAGAFLLFLAARDRHTQGALAIHRMLALRTHLRQNRVLPTTLLSAGADMPLVQLAPHIPRRGAFSVLVLDPGTGEELGRISQFQIAHLLLSDPAMPLRRALTHCQENKHVL